VARRAPIDTGAIGHDRTMPKLTNTEVDELLVEPGLLVRAGTTDADGKSRVLPLWFIVESRTSYFTPREPAVIWHNVRRDRRVGSRCTRNQGVKVADADA
jgi:hypothetical protein